MSFRQRHRRRASRFWLSALAFGATGVVLAGMGLPWPVFPADLPGQRGFTHPQEEMNRQPELGRNLSAQREKSAGWVFGRVMGVQATTSPPPGYVAQAELGRR